MCLLKTRVALPACQDHLYLHRSEDPAAAGFCMQELHESHLTLVEGSAFSERDLLHRAGLPGSLGAMVLADRCARDTCPCEQLYSRAALNLKALL
jgi:hypothetical protein